MGWRKTGEKVVKEEEISEQFCDVCNKTINEDIFPEFQLEIKWKKYEFEGDELEYLDICSLECLIAKAEELKTQKKCHMKKIGIAKKETFGMEPNKESDIILMHTNYGEPIQCEEVLVLDARFHCPHCDKGIVIHAEKKKNE